MNTHTRNLVRATLFALALSGLATPASAIVNWYNSSATDNKGGATVDNTITQAGWVDTFIGASVTAKSGRELSQVNGPADNIFNPPQVNSAANYMVFGFGDLGIDAGSTINSALLHVSATHVGAAQTYTIYGLTGTVDNNLEWTNAGLDINTANTYGTFNSFSGSGTVDLALAIKAYVDGLITGIAIGTTDSGGVFTNSSNFLQFATRDNSNDALRPSLMVDFVPEPSTYALIFGLVALVGVVRRRNNRSSSMPMPA